MLLPFDASGKHGEGVQVSQGSQRLLSGSSEDAGKRRCSDQDNGRLEDSRLYQVQQLQSVSSSVFLHVYCGYGLQYFLGLYVGQTELKLAEQKQWLVRS